MAEGALRRGLARAPSLEAQRRIETLLEGAGTLTGNPDYLRQLRMVETMEIIGGPEARRLLERLASGFPEARLTREAKATLGRMAK